MTTMMQGRIDGAIDRLRVYTYTTRDSDGYGGVDFRVCVGLQTDDDCCDNGHGNEDTTTAVVLERVCPITGTYVSIW